MNRNIVDSEQQIKRRGSFLSHELNCMPPQSKKVNLVQEAHWHTICIEVLGCVVHIKGIEIRYIQSGKPTQNAYIERFNRSY